jgi:hypothetical protein
MKTIPALCFALSFLLSVQHAVAATGCPGNGPTNSHVIAEYIFQEGSGTSTINSGTDGEAGDATLTNGAVFSADVPPSNAGCGWTIALPSSGSGSTTPAVETSTDYDPLAGATQFVIMAWVKRESASSNNNTSARIVSDTSSTALTNTTAGFEFRFSGNAGTLALRVNGNELSTTVGGIAPNSNAWHHVCVVYDGSRPATNSQSRHAHFFVDGVQRGLGVSNAVLNVAVEANTNRLTIGNSSVGRGVNNLLVGKIDDVRILRDFAPDAVGNGKTNAVILCFMEASDDFEPPTISCPANLTMSTDSGQCTATGVALGSPQSGDNCGVASVVNDAPATFPLGTTVVNWTATDLSGNTAGCQQIVTVVDNEAPQIACPGNVTIEAGACFTPPASVNLGQATATDNCSVSSITAYAPSPYAMGTNIVTWTATDSTGNGASCEQRVIVVPSTTADCDGDGLTDWDEIKIYQTDPDKRDTDGDQNGDGWELSKGLSPLDASDAIVSAEGTIQEGIECYVIASGSKVFVSGLSPAYEHEGIRVQFAGRIREDLITVCLEGIPLQLTQITSLDTDDDGLSDVDEFAYGTDMNNPDTDGDLWMDGAEVSAGESPTDLNSHPEFDFTINGGADVVTNPNLLIQFTPGIKAHGVVFGENFQQLLEKLLRLYSQTMEYSLRDSNDGIHTVYVQLLGNNGLVSPVIGRTIELDTVGPSISITSPDDGQVTGRRRVVLEGFAADAGDTPPQRDATKPLCVTVNGAFVNDRDADSHWWSGPHDLSEGVNTFTVVATDRAGFSVTSTVTVIYDPTLATTTPQLTVDISDSVVTVGATTTSFALMGGIDDDNATVEVVVVDAEDTTLTNAVVSAAVSGMRWWADVPVFPGTNLVVISAQNSASAPATHSFTMIQDAALVFEITSPVAGSTANASTVAVTGFASSNLSGATITINGQVATITTGPDGITFSGSVLINNVDANIVEVHAEGTDGSSATAREIVYGYEIVSMREALRDNLEHVDNDCFYAQHYPHTHLYGYEYFEPATWDAPAAQACKWYYHNSAALAGDCLGNCESFMHCFNWDTRPHWLWMSGIGWYRVDSLLQGYHLGHDYYDFSDCHVTDDCECSDQYCQGQSIENCCIPEAHEHLLWTGKWTDVYTFIKHWPSDEEQVVLLHFDEMQYWEPPTPFWNSGNDPNQITFWGQPGISVTLSDGTPAIGFVVKIKTNTRYTISENDFTFPTLTSSSSRHWPNAQSTETGVSTAHMLYFAGFGNEVIQLSSTKATKSPVTFEFGKTDIGDPCTDPKAKALVVFYKDVINKDLEVQAFDVKLEIAPPPSNATAQWTKHSGPDSGTLEGANNTTATYSNPSKGGLYRFDLSYLDKATRTQFLLPLAGPDTTAYFLSEAQRYDQWLSALKARLDAKTQDEFVKGSIILAYFFKTVANMNHKNQAIEMNGSPCKEVTDGTVTICGHAFGKDHIGNFLFSYMAARTGLTLGTTRFGADLVARLTTKVPDNPDDQAAYTAGFAYGENASEDFCVILASKDINAMQTERAKRAWPSDMEWPQANWVQYPTWGATAGLANPD